MSAPGTDGPFKGLASFEDSDVDARLFFGREREREIIVANLLASRLTVLYGESGVGKSSVLRAGVGPRPARAPGAADGRRVRRLAGRSGPCARVADRRGDGRRAAGAAGRHARARRRAGGRRSVRNPGRARGGVPLPRRRTSGRGSFLDEFSEAATRPGLRASFLLAVREDSLAKLDRFKSRVPNVFGNYLRLERLDRVAGREAILGPVDRYNETSTNGSVDVEPALVETVLDQVAAGKVELGRTGRGARAERRPRRHRGAVSPARDGPAVGRPRRSRARLCFGSRRSNGSAERSRSSATTSSRRSPRSTTSSRTSRPRSSTTS